MPSIRPALLAVLSASCIAALTACGGGDGGVATTTTGVSHGTTTTATGTSITVGTDGSAGTTTSTPTSTGTPTTAGPGTAPAADTLTTAAPMVYANLRGASLGVNASLNGAVPFPADNAWNTDIRSKPVDPNSDNLIQSIGLNTPLHADFGSDPTIGIPYVVVAGMQAKVPMNWTAYGDESDAGPYPIPRNVWIEGGASSGGDRHVIVVDKDNQRIYESSNSYPRTDGGWDASGGAVFHTDSDNVRPTAEPGWTSADAAGLPIFPGLVRYDEASKGAGGIRHALRFTIKLSRKAYVPPANHWASSNTSVNLPPMGMRVRLKASYVIPSTFSNEAKAILTAMKTYGMIVADNGSNWYVSGAPDPHWNDSRLSSELRQVKGSNFEVVRMDGLVTR